MFKNATFYQKTVLGKILAWRITQENDTLIYEWGYIDSSNWQKTEEKIKPIHEGTVAAKTGAENAALHYDRVVQKRLDAGYYKTEEEAQNSNLDIDLSNLPKSFSASKPISSKPCLDKKDPKKTDIPNKEINKLIEEGRLWAQRKANGCRAYYVRDQFGKSHFFSRKMKDISNNFPIIKGFLDVINIPNGTILDMELTLGGGDTMKQYLAVSSMSPNTKPETAKEIYKQWLEKNPNDFLTAIVFDVIFFNGSPVIQLPYEERYKILESCIPYHENNKPYHNGNFFSYIVRPFVFKDFSIANKTAREKGWEGLILWDKEMTSEYTVNGKPRRLKGCWKWKTDKTSDCIVLDVLPQEGNNKLVGALSVGQYDDKGNIVRCGNVGSGINEKTELEAWDWKGKVVEIKYFERMPQNDKGEICFQFPVIIGLRKDKKPSECIFDEDES